MWIRKQIATWLLRRKLRRWLTLTPTPTPQELDSMLEKVHVVRLFGGGAYRNKLLGEKVLLEVSKPEEIAVLRERLKIVERPGGHCLCCGGPTLELLSSDLARLALLSIHHGKSIRWDWNKQDALLADGRGLLEWLAERGVHWPLRRLLEEQECEKQRRDAWNHWVESTPQCLKELPQETWRKVSQCKEFTPALAALVKAYSDVTERILVLLNWYGNGAGPWTGYPAYEELPGLLLLEFSTDDIVDAVGSSPLTQVQLEGTARFFAGVAAPIPAALRRRLLDYCRNSADPDKRQRGESAFSS